MNNFDLYLAKITTENTKSTNFIKIFHKLDK